MNELTDLLRVYQELGIEFLEVEMKDPKQQLAAIHASILNCRNCSLHQKKTNYVPGEGPINPDIMFIGEAPGETEDALGKPFVGKAGQILEKIIEKMGYQRQSVFIGNIVKCRPPGNRVPLKDEAAACAPFLTAQILWLKPKVIVCLGKTAVNYLLNNDQPIGKLRGKQLMYGTIPVIPTFHPSYILHQQSREDIHRAKCQVWDDMQLVLQIIKK
jgi:DNA polymerase